MSEKTFTFALISASKKHMEIENTLSVSVPTKMGTITVLAHHEPLVAAVAPGIMTIKSKMRTSEYAIWAWVLQADGKKLTVLADMVDDGEDDDVDQVRKKKEEAQRLMDDARKKWLVTSDEYVEAELEFMKLDALEHRAMRSAGRI